MIAILSQDKRYLCMYGVGEATMVRCESKFVYIRTGSKEDELRIGAYDSESRAMDVVAEIAKAYQLGNRTYNMPEK